MVSSRSFAPDPVSSTTAGCGPGVRGRVSVPGTARGPVPTVTSCSVNESGSAYSGARHGPASGRGAISVPGVISSPVSQPPATDAASVNPPCSAVTGTRTSTVPGPATSLTGAPADTIAPSPPVRAAHAARSPSAGTSPRSDGANRSATRPNSPARASFSTLTAICAGASSVPMPAR